MDYWANADAVTWFALECFPAIRKAVDGVRFVIVGARPSRQVERLASGAGVEVTGSVPDVRPYLAHAEMAVAPMRVARGLQSKILEAMAMELPVAATSAALAGLDLPMELRRGGDRRKTLPVPFSSSFALRVSAGKSGLWDGRGFRKTTIGLERLPRSSISSRTGAGAR
jgi:hypothetical protein